MRQTIHYLFLFMLLVSGTQLLCQEEVIKIRKVDTCGVNLIADTTLSGQQVRLSLLRLVGIPKQKDADEIRKKLGYQQMKVITVSMDSICRAVRPIRETKKYVLTAVKVTRTDEPAVTDYSYVMVQFIYEPKKK